MTDKELMQQALDALELVTANMLDCRDQLAERGGRPTTNVVHQRLWDAAHKTYTDNAIPVAEALRARLAPGEPTTWRNAAIRIGEELSSVGPDGYYNMTAEQWLDWAMDQSPRGKNSLPQGEPEPQNHNPVAWMCPDDPERETAFSWKAGNCVDCGRQRVPVYAAPQQREWQGLTDEEIRTAASLGIYEKPLIEFARAIEAKLKEKNT